MSSGVVYVPDDEETIEDEAQLPADDSELIWRSKPGAIELQIRICILLCCVLFALGVLVSLAWRQYGGLIMRRRSTAHAKPSDGMESPETTAIRGALKKHR